MFLVWKEWRLNGLITCLPILTLARPNYVIFGPKICRFQYISNFLHQISMKLCGNVLGMKRMKTEWSDHMFANSSPGKTKLKYVSKVLAVFLELALFFIIIVLFQNSFTTWKRIQSTLSYVRFTSKRQEEVVKKWRWKFSTS